MIRRIIVRRKRVMVSLKTFHCWLNVRGESPCEWVRVEDVADGQSHQCDEGGGGKSASGSADVVILNGMVHPTDATAVGVP